MSSILVGKTKDKKKDFYTDAKDIKLHTKNGCLNHSLKVSKPNQQTNIGFTLIH